jgi:hypothetical protein
VPLIEELYSSGHARQTCPDNGHLQFGPSVLGRLRRKQPFRSWTQKNDKADKSQARQTWRLLSVNVMLQLTGGPQTGTLKILSRLCKCQRNVYASFFPASGDLADAHPQAAVLTCSAHV